MFIAFDGMDGTGKNTQVDRLEEFFKRKGENVIKLDFGGTACFKEYINKLNSKKIDVPAEIRELIYYFEGLYLK